MCVWGGGGDKLPDLMMVLMVVAGVVVLGMERCVVGGTSGEGGVAGCKILSGGWEAERVCGGGGGMGEGK